MTSCIIYHNPRCSKSRQTLDLLQKNTADIEIVEYLKNPPTAKQLKAILKSLEISPQELMRHKESEYIDSGLNNPDLTVDQQIALMIRYPKVIERPIVVKGNKAVIGRPPESILDLF